MTCELCGCSAPTIKEGPFAGSEGMLDYCGYCSKNLCDSCMAKGYCSDNRETHKHEASGDNEE